MRDKKEIKERFLKYHDAIEDLLIRQLIYSEEPVSSEDLALRTHLVKGVINKKLYQSDDAEVNEDGKWELNIDD